MFMPLKFICLVALVFALSAPPAFAGDDWKRELEARYQDGQLQQLREPDWLWQLVLQHWDRLREEREEEEKQGVENCIRPRSPLWHAGDRDRIRYWIGAVEAAAEVGAGGQHEGMVTLSGLLFVGLILAFAAPALIVLVIGVTGAIRLWKFKLKGVWWHFELPEPTTSDIVWAQRAIWSQTRNRHSTVRASQRQKRFISRHMVEPDQLSEAHRA
jgi:hypothetical protein